KMDSYNNIESSIADGLDCRPLKKAKCEQLNDCDLSPSPPSSTSLASSCDNIESSNVYDLDAQPLKEEKGDQMNDLDISLSPSSGTTLPSSSPVNNDRRILLDDEKHENHHEQFKVDQTYDYLPQDYEMTDLDYCALITIETSLEYDILVKIDDIFVTQSQLSCLLDPKKFLNDDVISAYICCIKYQTHLQSRNDVKFYFENPFISVILKRDGKFGVGQDGNHMTKIVRNYLKHEMILIPINIKETHWYLAIINTQKCEIQVLDSLCWDSNRGDLADTLQGLQFHLDIIGRQQNLISHNWKDLQVISWIITEQLQEPIQKDGSSCGLFMLKFMEYWTGDSLSHPITQEDINCFRYKLAGILLCWKTNTAQTTPKNISLLGNSDDQKEPKATDSLLEETKYQSLMSILSKISENELIGGLCDYIKSINCPETLEEVWVRNSKPYSISLTVRKLQEILKEDLPMDCDCMNLVIRKFMFDEIQMMKKTKGTISKHYLDTRFWMITDYGRHPNFRKKLDVDQLAETVCSWPGVNYSVSRCKLILIPIVQFNKTFILFILNQDTRTVYILDPTPLDPVYKYNPNARYVKKLLCIAEFLPKAMSKVCPGSRWSEDVFLWRQIILSDVPIENRELSGYLVSLFMCIWKDEELRLPILKDGYELRKQFMAQLLTYKDNECEDNLPAGVRDFLRCINATQS
uniref:Ubiquitin-like protease family profile domain-containing protein n=1 Tax=Setaria italica TaxID=4555 RepID=K3YYG4_SETIT